MRFIHDHYGLQAMNAAHKFDLPMQLPLCVAMVELGLALLFCRWNMLSFASKNAKATCQHNQICGIRHRLLLSETLSGQREDMGMMDKSGPPKPMSVWYRRIWTSIDQTPKFIGQMIAVWKILLKMIKVVLYYIYKT